MIETIKVDRWSEPDANQRVQHIGMINAQDAFNQLEKHLKAKGLLPDEYFLFSAENFNGGKAELPNYEQAICQVDFGASEGIYLDIILTVKGDKPQFIHFATGKTLSAHADAYRHMSRIAGECSMMLNGRGMEVSEQWEHENDPKLFVSEFEKKIKPLGFTFSSSGNKGEYTLMHFGVAVGRYDAENSDLYLKRTALGDELTNKLRMQFYTTLEYIREYSSAPPLCANGVSDYRELCSLNGVVLAAKHRGENGFQFVTWSYTYDGNGVAHGNYFDDYEAAKRDFVRRSELLPPSVVFNKKELSLIAAAINVAGQSDKFVQKLTDEERTLLAELSERVSSVLSSSDYSWGNNQEMIPLQDTPIMY